MLLPQKPAASRNPSLLDPARSILVVVDLQERFRGAVPGFDAAVARAALLAKAAGRLGVPVQVSEQVPDKLGSTVSALADALPADATTVPKSCFSAADAPEWTTALKAARRDQVVLCGVEAHVCVLQTALDLAQDAARGIYVVEDAVASRRDADKAAALRRLESHGIQPVTSEMVVFEWLRKAGTPEFRELQALVKE